MGAMGDIKYDDLCNLIALEMGYKTTPKSVDRYLKSTYRVILQQLKFKKRIYFKNFGYWEIKERKSGEREINDPVKGGRKLFYVKPKYSIFFKPSINFDLSVNENDFKIIAESKAKKIKKSGKNKSKNNPTNYVDVINKANSRIVREE